MKRILSLFLVLLLLVSLSACGQYDDQDLEVERSNGYYDGYDEGYREGRRDGYSEGYEDGHSAVSDAQNSMQWDAEQYAREKSGWNPEEALGIIDDYRTGSTEYLGYVPTWADYMAAIDSLYYFYEYYYLN